MSPGVVGIQFDGFFVGADGFLYLSQPHESRSQVQVGRRIGGPQVNGPGKQGGGGLKATGAGGQEAEAEGDFGHGGIELGSLVECQACPVVVLLSHVDQSQAGEADRIFRVQDGGAAETAGGFLQFAALGQENAQAAVGALQLGIELDGVAVLENGFVVMALQGVLEGQVVARRRRADGDRPAVAGAGLLPADAALVLAQPLRAFERLFSLLPPFEPHVGLGQVEVDLRRIGVEFGGLFEVLDGFGILAFFPVDESQIEEAFGIFGVETDGLLKEVGRLFYLPMFAIEEGQLLVGLGHGGIEVQGFQECPFRLGNAVPVGEGQTQVEVSRGPQGVQGKSLAKGG